MNRFWTLKIKSNVVIKIDVPNSRGFVPIVCNDFRGMDQISEETLEEHFNPCDEEYFLKHKDANKFERREHGKR